MEKPAHPKRITSHTMSKIARDMMEEIKGEEGRLKTWVGMRLATMRPIRVRKKNEIYVKSKLPRGSRDTYREQVSLTYRLKCGQPPMAIHLSYNPVRGTHIRLNCDGLYPGYSILGYDEAGNVHQVKFIGAGLPNLAEELSRLMTVIPEKNDALDEEKKEVLEEIVASAE